MMEWRGGQFPLEVIRGIFAVFGAVDPGRHAWGSRGVARARRPQARATSSMSSSPVEVPTATTIRSAGSTRRRGAGVDILHLDGACAMTRGDIVGTAWITKPAVGMAIITRMTAIGDLRHFERMEHVAKPGRRAAAVLFADLESSSPLSRRLSTASYFALVRRLARAADQCVIDAGGLVGSHAGDGVVAFFLAETSGSESAAARACIAAARSLRDAVGDIAARSELRARGRRAALRHALGGQPLRRPDRDRADGPRSPRSATRSTRPRASRRAPPAAARSPRKTSSSASHPDDAAALDLEPRHHHLHGARRPEHRDREGPPRRASHRRLQRLARLSQSVQSKRHGCCSKELRRHLCRSGAGGNAPTPPPSESAVLRAGSAGRAPRASSSPAGRSRTCSSPRIRAGSSRGISAA